MDISVIVPIYNVDRYIEQCLRSIFTQTKTDAVEFILINDCTPDNSSKIVNAVIREFPHLDIIIINHLTNEGIAAARLTGLRIAKGDYIQYVDADDWCEPTMLEELYTMAVESRADFVAFDYVNVYHDKQEVIKGFRNCSKNDLWRLYFEERLFHNIWSKFVKRELFNKEGVNYFISGINYMEDFMASCKLTYYASEIQYLEKPLLYHLKSNDISLMSLPITSKRIADIVASVYDIENFLNISNFSQETRSSLNRMKLKIKYEFICRTKGERRREVIRIFPETNNQINLLSFKSIINKMLFASVVRGHLFIYLLLVLFSKVYMSFKKWIFQ